MQCNPSYRSCRPLWHGNLAYKLHDVAYICAIRMHTKQVTPGPPHCQTEQQMMKLELADVISARTLAVDTKTGTCLEMALPHTGKQTRSHRMCGCTVESGPVYATESDEQIVGFCGLDLAQGGSAELRSSAR